MKVQAFLLLVIFSFFKLYGQEKATSDTNSYASDSLSFLVNYDHIYKENIKTAVLNVANSKYREPVISLLTGSKLQLQFDDFSNDFREYRYDIIHCDRYWQPSAEERSQYLKRNFERIIENYTFSSATKAEYVTYLQSIPGEDESFLKSGNFLLHVYEAESDSIVLTKRFMVVDPSVSITGKIVRTDDVRFSEYRQQVQFELYDPKDAIQDVGMIYVRIAKNASWDIYCDEIKPSFVNNDRIYFERPDACTFDGGNEYRFFNMLEYRNMTNNIVKVEIKNSGLHEMWLDVEEGRSYLQYSSQVDHNGKRLYQGDQKSFNSNELDYALINFRLKTGEVFLDREIYLYGELSNYRLDEDFKMTYDPTKDIYVKKLMLKQGLYGYEYVAKSIYEDGPDESIIEGSHFETENDYTIFVYYSNPFEGYDQLLGIERLNSQGKIDQLNKK